MKKKDKDKAAWAVIGAGSAMVAGMVVDRALNRGTRQFNPNASHIDPTARNFSWLRAMAWTAGTAAIVSIAELAAVRGVALGWKKTKGKLPRSF